jgi:putative FmdB family regulatory protein
MPTYDYLCNQCGHRFEFFQRMNDAVLVACPNCHHDALQRLIGAGAGLLFKGSGFYLTDYRKSSSSPAKAGNSSTAEHSSSEDKSPPKEKPAAAAASSSSTDSGGGAPSSGGSAG